MSTSRKEMAANAARWSQVARKEIPDDLGYIFIFFPKNAMGHGAGIVVSNIKDSGVDAELKSILKRPKDFLRLENVE